MTQRPDLESSDLFAVKNTPLRPRERQQLLELPEAHLFESPHGEVILAPARGQQRVWWGYNSAEDMRQEFPGLWSEVLQHVDREHTDYVAMDISGLSNRSWLEPILRDADFEFFAEWMEMANPDITGAAVPEFPEGVTMRKATEDDLERFYEIWAEAYGDYSDGPATFDWLADEFTWAGALEDEDGDVVAFAMTGPVERGEGSILAAAVAPEAWGNGYGRAVLGAATYALAAQGAVKATIRVRPDVKESLRTCSSLGYRHQKGGLEYRRDTDEEAIAERREERRVAGVKARFGKWR